MLGIYRFFLASVVVLFHFGEGSWVSGKLCVFAFYTLSGFLIFHVIEHFYAKYPFGIPAFLINRALRLLPTFLLVYGLTYFLIEKVGMEGYLFAGEKTPFFLFPPKLTAQPFTHYLNELLPLFRVEPTPGIYFWTSLAPQGWSVGIEECFYITAILLCVFPKKLRSVLFYLAFLTSVMFFVIPSFYIDNPSVFDQVIYKNYFATLFFFLAGRIFAGLPIDPAKWKMGPITGYQAHVISCLVFMAYMVGILYFFDFKYSTSVFYANAVIVFLFSMLILSTYKLGGKNKFGSKIDEYLGKLTYGIYINHFLAGNIGLYLNQQFLLGMRMNKPTFGIFVWTLSILISILFYHLIEGPIENARESVKAFVKNKRIATQPTAVEAQTNVLYEHGSNDETGKQGQTTV